MQGEVWAGRWAAPALASSNAPRKAACSGVFLPSLLQSWLFFILLQALGFGGTPARPGALRSLPASPLGMLASGGWAGTPACSLCWLAVQAGWGALVLNFVFLTPRLREKTRKERPDSAAGANPASAFIISRCAVSL